MTRKPTERRRGEPPASWIAHLAALDRAAGGLAARGALDPAHEGDPMKPIRNLNGREVRYRALTVGDASLPLTSGETTVLRLALERVAAQCDEASLATASARRPAMRPSAIRGIARGLLHYLLEGEIEDFPDIAAWRARAAAEAGRSTTAPAPVAVGAVAGERS